MFEPKVFISHADSDLAAVKAVQNALVKYGIEGVYFGEQSSLHTNLTIDVKTALTESYAVVVLVSANWLVAGAVSDDLSFARTVPVKTILPVSIDGTQIPEWMQKEFAFMAGKFDVNRVAEIMYEVRPQRWSTTNEPQIHFPSDVTSEEVSIILSGLASYWRSCGGIGMPVEFDALEVMVEEPANV